MGRRQFEKIFIEAMVRSILEEMETEFDRALAKLEEMANGWAKGNQSWNQWMQDGLRMVHTEGHPYRQLLQQVVRQVDHGNLALTGINLLYPVFRGGSQKETTDFQMVSLPSGLSLAQWEVFLAEGKARGKYCYLWDCQALTVPLLIRMGREKECVFGLYFSPGNLPQDLALQLRSCPNVVCILDMDDEGFSDGAQSLREQRCLYGAFRQYRTKADAEKISSGQWAREAAQDGCVFAAFQAGVLEGEGLAHKVCLDIKMQRSEPREPIFLLNGDVDFSNMMERME